MNDLRACWFVTVGIVYLPPEGEGRNGRVRCAWGQIRFSLPFAVFLTCITASNWYLVYNIQRSCREWCIFWFTFSLFLTERLPHQQMTESHNTCHK